MKKLLVRLPIIREQLVLAAVTENYLESRDFNGLPAAKLVAQFGLKIDDLKAAVRRLIRSSHVTIEFGAVHPNPFIKALPPRPVEEQLRHLEQAGMFCVYPSEATLHKAVTPERDQEHPFRRMLALGRPQLEFLHFDQRILIDYRDDPRFFFEHNDISGRICITDDHYEEVDEADRVLLEMFGFSFDSELKRSVAVALRYLARLPSEHQTRWLTRKLDGEFKLHPAYAQQVAGAWPKGISVFSATVGELAEVNVIAKLIGKPPLFKKEFVGEARPREFGFMLIPTLKEYNDFIQLLDKMISENIDRKFFAGDIELTEEQAMADGKVRLIDKGTLRLLEEWVNSKLNSDGVAAIRPYLATLKKVRKLRQNPAHTLNENEFDGGLLDRQRELITEVNDAVRALRQFMQKLPAAESYESPARLNGDRWVY